MGAAACGGSNSLRREEAWRGEALDAAGGARPWRRGAGLAGGSGGGPGGCGGDRAAAVWRGVSVRCFFFERWMGCGLREGEWEKEMERQG